MKWFGHAAFYLVSPAGVRVVTDPFGSDVPYPEIEVECDVVTVSHEHFDHNAVSRISGEPAVLRGTDVSYQMGDSRFISLPSFHDNVGGKSRGVNAIFVMDLGGMTVVHMGDLGHHPSQEVIDEISGCDILLIPVGGHYTVDGRTAADICKRVPPRVVVPMHYRTPYISSWPIKGPEEFLEAMGNVRRLGTDSIDVTKDSLPDREEVWLFQL